MGIDHKEKWGRDGRGRREGGRGGEGGREGGREGGWTHCKVAEDVVPEVEDLGALPARHAYEVGHVALLVDQPGLQPRHPPPRRSHAVRVQAPERTVRGGGGERSHQHCHPSHRHTHTSTVTPHTITPTPALSSLTPSHPHQHNSHNPPHLPTPRTSCVAKRLLSPSPIITSPLTPSPLTPHIITHHNITPHSITPHPSHHHPS